MTTREKIEILREERDKRRDQSPLTKKKYKMNYITGVSAFNIPYQGDMCDWHQVAMLENMNLTIHPKNLIGGEDLFGGYGIWDCSSFWSSKGIDIHARCASPIRAILDILYQYIVVYREYPTILNDMWDNYMFDGINRDELTDKLEFMRSHLTLEQQEIFERWREKNEVY